jgi:3-hydroxyisobutyrate dehydrogenase
MGYPMAGHLALAGHRVTVYNRSPAKAAAWVAEFAATAKPRTPPPRQAAAGADIVFCCVGNDDDLRSVTLGADGALAGMKPGAIFVDHTTASADVARELARPPPSSACSSSTRRCRAARPARRTAHSP